MLGGAAAVAVSSGSIRRCGRRTRGAGRVLLRVSRREGTVGRPAAGHERRGDARHHARRFRRQPDRQTDHRRGRTTADADGRRGALRRQDRPHPQVDRQRRGVARRGAAAKKKHWAFIPPVRPAVSALRPPDRRVRAGAARARGTEALARSRSRHPAAPPEPRPDRSAAHAPRARRLPRRPVGQCLREAGGPPARLAALWRALGTHLAGRARATPIPTATRRTRRASSGSIATG